MIIRLKNFRCYTEKEFDFGRDGIVLLSGPSGSGKSSIMMAILFCLYGTGNKLTSIGKTNCQVEIEFDEIKITRTKRPNFLRLTNILSLDEYEGDAAQGVINERFGNAFDITSYVQQNAYNSFVLMNPLEKLSFLEKFAFHGIDLSKIKGKCTAIIKKRNEELISTTSQLQMASEHLKSLSKPVRISFPIKTNNIEKTIKNESVRLKNTRTLLKRCEKNIILIQQELNDTNIFMCDRDSKLEMIYNLKDKIKNDEESMLNISYIGDKKLTDYEEKLRNTIKKKKLYTLKEKYTIDLQTIEDMEVNERTHIKEECEKIDDILWKEYTSEDVNKNITDYIHILKDIEKIDRLNEIKNKNTVDEKNLENNKNLLKKIKIELTYKNELLNKLKIQQETFTCPVCDSTLKLGNNKLYVFEKEKDISGDIEEVQTSIKKLSKKISELEYVIPNDENKKKINNDTEKNIQNVLETYEDELPLKEDAQNTLDYLKEYKRCQEELEKKKSKLMKQGFSQTLENFRIQVEKQKKEIKEYEGLEDYDGELDEDTIRDLILKEKNKKHTLEIYNKNVYKNKRECHELNERLLEIESNFSKKYQKLNTLSGLEDKLNSEKSRVEQLKEDETKYEKNEKKIEQYVRYTEEKNRYNEWVKKVSSLTGEEEDNRKRYSAATQLKEKILEAESLAILNIINSINTHAQEYLDIFFPVDPIVVRLLPFKQGKKNVAKPQINIEIDYKGMDADINMLSGGELARVILAFTLALGEIFNSPLIMLDECTASLDQDMTSIVMEGIRKNFSNKLVIVIAHQVISGEFDRQVIV